MEDLLFESMIAKLKKVGKIVIVASGKGGVGKSLVSSSLAIASAEMGYKTGLLDLDLHGPSAHKILNFKGDVVASKSGLKPPVVRGVKLMSLGLISDKDPLPFKGEGKRSIISLLIALTEWGDLDHLFIDMPPGTGDETILSIRALKNLGNSTALVVTTPSHLSISVVARLINLLRGEGIRILGLVENMSYVRCGASLVRPFGSIDEEFLRAYGLSILTSLPMDPKIEEGARHGMTALESSEDFRSGIEDLLKKIVEFG